MANIYDVNQALIDAIEMGMDPETGEILDCEDLQSKLNELHLALSEKIENSVWYKKNIDADIEAFKIEEDKLELRRKRLEKKSVWIQNYIDHFIRSQFIDEFGNFDEEGLNKYKFITPRCEISYRKSKGALQIKDLSIVPKEYVKPHVLSETDIDKMKIKQDMKDKNLTETEYAVINKSIGIQIK